MLEADLC
jgi:hypothetical protein